MIHFCIDDSNDSTDLGSTNQSRISWEAFSLGLDCSSLPATTFAVVAWWPVHGGFRGTSVWP